MNNRFHSKYHRYNHHTYTNPLIPDAGHDPIASPDSPFLGDFVISGALSGYAPLSAYAATFTGTKTALKVESPDVALAAIGNTFVFGDVYIAGELTGPYIPVLYGRAGKSYSFSYGLSSSPTTNDVSLVLDLTSLYLNPAGQVAVNLNSIADILSNKYTFSNGLLETPIDSTQLEARSLVSVNVDNISTCINSEGRLSLVDYYKPGSGLAYDQNSGNLAVNVDQSSIKICNNSLQIGYNLGAPGSGLIRDGDNIKINVDNSSLKIANNLLTSNYNFSNGICLNTSNNKYEIGLNTDNSTIRVSPSNQLEAINVLKTNLVSTEQSVEGPVNFNKGIKVSSDGIKFPDGSTLVSGFVANKVVGISKPSTNNQNVLIITNSKNIMAWGLNEYFSPSFKNNDPMWPPQPINFENSYNFSQGAFIEEVQHSSEGVTALLTDGTLWSNGFPVLGYSPGTDADGDYILKQITFPNSSKITKFEVFSSGLNSKKYTTNENIRPSRTCIALSEFGEIFLFGNLRNDKKTTESPLALIENTSEWQQTPVKLSYVSSSSTSPDNLEPSIGFEDVKLIKVCSATSSTSESGNYGSIILALKDNVLYTAGYVDSDEANRSLGFAILNGSLFDRNTTVPGSNKIPNYWYRLMPVLHNVRKIIRSPYYYKTIYVIKTDGTVWACGLGSGMNSSSPTFVQQFPSILTNITDMVVMRSPVDDNKSSFCAINNSGSVFVWGYNASGHLGSVNINASITTPTLVPSLPPITKLFCNTVFGRIPLPSGSTVDNYESGVNKSVRVLGLLANNGLMYIAGKTFERWFTNFTSSSFNPIPVGNVVDVQFTSEVSTSSSTSSDNLFWKFHNPSKKQAINGIFIRDSNGRLFVLTKEATYSLAGFGLGVSNQPLSVTNSSPIELSAWL